MSNKNIDAKYNSPINHPCLKEQELSSKCLNDNKYDYNACTWYFDNYKQCKKFWGDVMIDRLNKRIFPTLPPPEEREAIKQEYLENLKNSKRR